MWPKILLELIPHFARLAPVADKFLTGRSGGDKAQEAALTAMSEGVRGDLEQLTEAHSGIYRLLQEQNAQVSEMAVEMTRTRIVAESVEARVAKLEHTAGVAMRLVVATLTMLAAALILLALVLIRVPHVR